MVDYYQVLGISKTATLEEIKRAYKTLARKYHPDVNKDPKAHDKFTEVSEAYAVLSDSKKRAAYDSGGGSFSDFFNGADANESFVQDIFSNFFGGGAGGGGFSSFFGQGNSTRTQNRASFATAGRDATISIKLTLNEILHGVDKKVKLSTADPCNVCNATGSKNMSKPGKCSYCNGSGEVRHSQQTGMGLFITTSACSKCNGTGMHIVNPCVECDGLGRINITKEQTLSIPAGLVSGTALRLSEIGEAGIRGGKRGDIIVEIQEQEDNNFKREGLNIVCILSIPLSLAIVGGKHNLNTLNGVVEVNIPKNSYTGQVLIIKNKGIPILNKQSLTYTKSGDLQIMLSVDIPNDLTEEEIDTIKSIVDKRDKKPFIKKFYEESSWANRLRKFFK